MADRLYGVVNTVAALFTVTPTAKEKIALYDEWTGYDQDVIVLDYKAPHYAADSISTHFSGDREAAVVLDVACGTGEVAKQMKKKGFNRFVGIDGSRTMLEGAKKTGLYQDLKQCILGEQDLPVEKGSFDIVLICGGLRVDLIGVSVLREMCNACKPGGLLLMTTSHGLDDLVYTAALEREQKQIEDEGLWKCVAVTPVEKWLRSMTEETGYMPGSVYVYKKTVAQSTTGE